MSIRTLNQELKKFKENTNLNQQNTESTNSDQQDIEIKNQAETETENQNYLLLEQFLNLSNNLVNIPNLNELTQKYTENNPDKFATEIEHLYSIIDTISPKQFK